MAKKRVGEKPYVAPGGAKRSELAPFIHLIPLPGLLRVAERYTLGSLKYDDADDQPNWRKGLRDPAFLNQAKDHMALHMFRYFREGCKTDDNLAAIVWGCFTLMEAEHVNGNREPHPAGSQLIIRPREKRHGIRKRRSTQSNRIRKQRTRRVSHKPISGT